MDAAVNDHERALKCALYYRSLGLVPLPSRMDKKGVALTTYAQYRTEPVPDSIYYGWKTSNVQLLTGIGNATPIAVVDCDGDEARGTWKAMCLANGYIPSKLWIARSGGGGRHFYFRIPHAIDCPSRLLWGLWNPWGQNGKGAWVKHTEIRLIADGNQIVAPPSVHVEKKKRYEFLTGWGPKDHPLPAFAPDWLAAMPGLVPTPQCYPEAPKAARVTPTCYKPMRFICNEDVIAAIPDMIALAKEWGVVFTGGVGYSGWAPCWVPGREEPGRSKSRSGSFYALSGSCRDHATGETMRIFDVGVATGQFADWRECRDWCGARFLGSSQFSPRENTRR